MSKERDEFLKEIIKPLVVALACGLAAIILSIARPIVRNSLYRDLIYSRPDISNVVMSDIAFSTFVVVNESCFETDGNIELKFQLYKDPNVQIVLNGLQDTSTGLATSSRSLQMSNGAKKIYLSSPEGDTSFVLQPKLGFQEEGVQTVKATKCIHLEMTEATCVAVVLWNFPTNEKLSNFNLTVDNRKCKSYQEYLTYKLYLKHIRGLFYCVFWVILSATIFAIGVVYNKWHEHRKAENRRKQERNVEAAFKGIE